MVLVEKEFLNPLRQVSFDSTLFSYLGFVPRIKTDTDENTFRSTFDVTCSLIGYFTSLYSTNVQYYII